MNRPCEPIGIPMHILSRVNGVNNYREKMEKLEAEKLAAELERQRIEKEERENLRKQQQAEDNLPPEPAAGTAGVRRKNVD